MFNVYMIQYFICIKENHQQEKQNKEKKGKEQNTYTYIAIYSSMLFIFFKLNAIIDVK